MCALYTHFTHLFHVKWNPDKFETIAREMKAYFELCIPG